VKKKVLTESNCFWAVVGGSGKVVEGWCVFGIKDKVKRLFGPSFWRKFRIFPEFSGVGFLENDKFFFKALK